MFEMTLRTLSNEFTFIRETVEEIQGEASRVIGLFLKVDHDVSITIKKV